MWERGGHHPTDATGWGGDSLEPDIPGGYSKAVPVQESGTFFCP